MVQHAGQWVASMEPFIKPPGPSYCNGVSNSPWIPTSSAVRPVRSVLRLRETWLLTGSFTLWDRSIILGSRSKLLNYYV